MFDVEKYYNNKAFELSYDTQITILRFLNNLDDKIEMAWRDKKYSRYDKFIANLQGAKALLDSLGIYAEIGWAGHRKEYFFPNGNDAEAQLEWFDNCRD